MWTAPETSAAAGRRSIFGNARPWADLAMEDVGGSSCEPMEVDISDIAFARQGLDLLEETRRNMATALLAEQRQFVQSRDFLAQQRRDIVVAREELSQTRAELGRSLGGAAPSWRNASAGSSSERQRLTPPELLSSSSSNSPSSAQSSTASRFASRWSSRCRWPDGSRPWPPTRSSIRA